MAFLQKLWEQIKNLFGGMSKKTRIRLGILAVVVIGLSIGIVYVLNRTTWDVLYTGEPGSDEYVEVTAMLQEQGVDPQFDGNAILVPTADVGRLRLMTYGLGKDVDLSYVQAMSGFGVTAKEQEIYARIQFQQEVVDHLKKMEIIKDCSVKMHEPEKSSVVLKPSQEKKTVSVIIETAGNQYRLSKNEANAIISEISKSFGIDEEQISLSDTKLNNYTSSAIATGDYTAAEQMELTARTKDELEESVINFLAPAFLAENVRIVVNPTLNFDKITTNEKVISPPTDGDNGMVVSSEEIYKAIRDSQTGDVPGTDTNGMGTVEYPYGELGDGEYYKEVSLKYNYDFNETLTTIDHATGVVKDVSIGVMINESVVGDVDTITAQVNRLLTNSLGTTEDKISVECLPFQKVNDPGQIPTDNAMDPIVMKNLIEQIIIGLVVLIILLAFISLMRALIKAVGDANKEPQMVLADGTGMNVDYIAGLDMGEGDEEEYESPYPDVDLSSKSEGVRQLESFIERDPQAVAQLLRNWLTDD